MTLLTFFLISVAGGVIAGSIASWIAWFGLKEFYK
jgi:hypothetical protein